MKVIIINGPMGVGKTTVGKAIADKCPGTAFIDGDWCMDLHPFVGNRETKAMAVDNILHMIGNYQKCSECKMAVLVWLMDDPRVLRSILDGLSALQTEVRSVTLICEGKPCWIAGRTITPANGEPTNGSGSACLPWRSLRRWKTRLTQARFPLTRRQKQSCRRRTE